MIQRKYYKTIRVIVDSDGGGTPFYIENVDTVPGYFKLYKETTTGTTLYTPNLNYRIDNGEWFEYDMTNLPLIEVPVGSKIYLKGNNPNGFNQDTYGYRLRLYSKVNPSEANQGHRGKGNIGGYITSLLSLDNFHLINHIPNNSFNRLMYRFTYKSTLYEASAENLITSNITSVGEGGFDFCFGGWETLVTAPTFDNVTSVGVHGFSGCFSGCTSLVTAPTFENVTSVGVDGFSSCFSGCTALVTAPTFENVTGVVENGFYQCFYNCTSLVTAPTFENVTSVGGTGGFRGCFNNCTSLITPPNFRKFTTVSGYYSFEKCFYSCTSLETIIAPRPSTWTTNNFSDWVSGVPSTGTFYKKKGLEIPTGVNGIPEGWTVVEEA